MQRRSRLLTPSFVAAALLTAVLSPVVPAVATEGVVPAWSKPIAEAQMSPDGIISQLNGDVTVAQCASSPSGDLVVKDYDRSGSSIIITREIASNSSPRPYVCPNFGSAVMGKNGTLYAMAANPWPNDANRLVAYNQGTMAWQVSPLPHNCHDIYSVAIGAHGNIYAMIGRCSSSQDRYLVGFEPDLDPGESAPDAVLDVQIADEPALTTSNSFDAYNDGLVVYRKDGIQFYSYNGVTNGPIAIAEITRSESNPEISTEGRTFAAIKANPGSSNWCPEHASDIVSHIAAYQASGIQWSSSLPACTQVHALQPTPDGGVVALTVVKDGIVNEYQLLALTQTGQQKWVKPLTPMPKGDPDVQITLSGDVAFFSRAVQGNSSTVYVSLLSGLTGEALYTAQFTPPGDNITVGYASSASGHSMAITHNKAYVVLNKCVYDWWSCGYEDTLYALNIPGIEIDYPRGAMLLADEPKFNLAVIGDSFSSGEGVEPFDLTTDINGYNECHRSHDAYANLLTSSSVRLNLQAFVACSGAKTQHITERWPNNIPDPKNLDENPQVDALSTTTDIVSLTIGGNDIEFAHVIEMCVHGQCQAGIEYARDRFSALSTNLALKYSSIRQRIGNVAKVYVLGYPQIVPTHERVDEKCEWLPIISPISDQDIAMLRSVAADLNNLIRAEAEKSNVHFKFLDTSSIFDGHELCTSNSYLIRVQPFINREYSIHPNKKGQDAYKRLLLSAISATS